MLSLRRPVALFLCLALAACDNGDYKKSASKPPPAENVVALSADEAAHLDIRAVALQATEYTPNVQGYGLVISFDALAQADSDVATAEAAARQSQASYVRQQHLARLAATSRETLDLAQKQAATDAAQLTLAQRKEAATFGRDAPWLDAARHAAIFAALSRGSARLIHASFPIGSLEGASPLALSVSRLDRAPIGNAWKTTTVWLAPADTTIPGRSVYALLEGSDLNDGERVLVSAPVAAPMHGILVPVDAIVLSEGQAWCYVAVGPDHFARRPVDTTRPMPGGYFVDKGLYAGAQVVVQGQSLLLAHEQAPAAATEDN